MPRLRDRAVVLVPQRRPDPNTAAPRIDWSVPPEEIPVPFEAQQQRAGGGDLEEGTALASWSSWLPPTVRLEDELVDLVARFHAGCRVSWHGREYSVDGPIRTPRKGGRVEFIAFTLRKADRRPAP